MSFLVLGNATDAIAARRAFLGTSGVMLSGVAVALRRKVSGATVRLQNSNDSSSSLTSRPLTVARMNLPPAAGAKP